MKRFYFVGSFIFTMLVGTVINLVAGWGLTLLFVLVMGLVDFLLLKKIPNPS